MLNQRLKSNGKSYKLNDISTVFIFSVNSSGLSWKMMGGPSHDSGKEADLGVQFHTQTLRSAGNFSHISVHKCSSSCCIPTGCLAGVGYRQCWVSCKHFWYLQTLISWLQYQFLKFTFSGSIFRFTQKVMILYTAGWIFRLILQVTRKVSAKQYFMPCFHYMVPARLDLTLPYWVSIT